jgi:hypothetical protein
LQATGDRLHNKHVRGRICSRSGISHASCPASPHVYGTHFGIEVLITLDNSCRHSYSSGSIHSVTTLAFTCLHRWDTADSEHSSVPSRPFALAKPNSKPTNMQLSQGCMHCNPSTRVNSPSILRSNDEPVMGTFPQDFACMKAAWTEYCLCSKFSSALSIRCLPDSSSDCYVGLCAGLICSCSIPYSYWSRQRNHCTGIPSAKQGKLVY